MPSGNRGGAISKMYILLAGVESGIVGGTMMLAWLGLVSLWQRQSLWRIPNLLASTFYGEAALRGGFRWSTLSGIAVQLAIAGVLGAAFGLVIGGYRQRFRVMLLGLMAGLTWYYFSFGFAWKRLNPFVTLYSPDDAMIVGHLWLGLGLGYFPAYLDTLRRDAPAEVERPA
jgi:hypothetical protein